MMPSINNKHCSKHGIYQGKRCPQCKQQIEKDYNSNSRNKENQSIYQSKKWRDLRQDAIIRDGFKCTNCDTIIGLKHRDHVVDHIIEIEDGGAAYDLENLQTLCMSCHNKKTKAKG